MSSEEVGLQSNSLIQIAVYYHSASQSERESAARFIAPFYESIYARLSMLNIITRLFTPSQASMCMHVVVVLHSTTYYACISQVSLTLAPFLTLSLSPACLYTFENMCVRLSASDCFDKRRFDGFLSEMRFPLAERLGECEQSSS